MLTSLSKQQGPSALHLQLRNLHAQAVLLVLHRLQLQLNRAAAGQRCPSPVLVPAAGAAQAAASTLQVSKCFLQVVGALRKTKMQKWLLLGRIGQP